MASKEYFDYFPLENNLQVLPIEDNFEETFNRVFKKSENPLQVEQDLDNEIENKIYFIQNINNFIPKEESDSILKKIGNFIPLKKVILNEEEYREEKSVPKNSVNESDLKDKKNFIIEIDENKIKHININTIQKSETNNSLTSESIKNKKFKVYSSDDFNLFHPGGTNDYFRRMKEEIFNDAIKLKKIEKKELENPLKFRILKESKKKGKKRNRDKMKRKEKPDNIRKKIKSRFLKLLKNRINEKLKGAKSKKFFDLLPQSFVTNISKKANKIILYLTFKELLLTQFYEGNDSQHPDKKKYENNRKALEYLDKNSHISKKANFDIIKNLKFPDMFDEYLKSEEFEKDILQLKIENNNEKYIKDYMTKAYSFIEYFSRGI